MSIPSPWMPGGHADRFFAAHTRHAALGAFCLRHWMPVPRPGFERLVTSISASSQPSLEFVALVVLRIREPA